MPDMNSQRELTDELETVIAIPPIPFQSGIVNQKAHRKNVCYLLENNFLDEGRRRAIGVAGTSLIHHIDETTLSQLVNLTGQVVRDRALVIAGLVATPPDSAKRFIERCMDFPRPPDFFLLMPIPGVCNPEGIRAEFSRLTSEGGESCGARFLLYLRSSSLIGAYTRLAATSPYIFGVKVGTCESDVSILADALPTSKKVLWGIGDRATEAARLGSRGHTSGITLICPKACDEINNAYRHGDFDTANEIEGAIAELEEIRFIHDRAYNYSAVLAAAQLAGFSDVDLGDGGPFNASPPEEIMSRISCSLEKLKDYH